MNKASSDNETFIKLLKEIRERDSLIQEIKTKIQEKDILIDLVMNFLNIEY